MLDNNSMLVPCQISAEFTHQLSGGQTDEAHSLFVQEFNRILHLVASAEDHEYHAKTCRGKHDQRRFPKGIGARASTLDSCKLSKAYNQAVEVSTASPGHRIDTTWASIPRVSRLMIPEQQSNFLRLWRVQFPMMLLLKSAKAFKIPWVRCFHVTTRNGSTKGKPKSDAMKTNFTSES